MNECILFANIGNSDIGKNNQPLFSIKHGEKINVYEKSKELYESGNFKDIELIILEPTISKIMKNYKIKKIFLFATEQRNSHQQDTKYCAEIAKKILCDKYKFSEKEIQILQISKNPADYDKMFRYYQEKNDEIKNNENTYVYVSLTGGTPAQTTALLFWSVLKFGNLIIPIYKPNKKGESAKELNIGSNIYKILLGERLESLESKKFYTVAAELAKEFKLKNDYEIMWLEAKAKRSLFDFDGALKILEECKKLQIIPQQKKRDVEKEIAEIKILTEKKDKKALIVELYENMKVVWEQGAYTDFIGRLFRFEEAVYHYLIFKKLGVDISIKRKYPEFDEKIKMDENLYTFLTSQKYGGQPLKMTVDRPLLFFILFYYKEEFGIVVDIFDKINDYKGSPDNSLGNLRNKSILAHGFEGVSKEKIIEKYKSVELMNDIEKIVNFIQDKY